MFSPKMMRKGNDCFNIIIKNKKKEMQSKRKRSRQRIKTNNNFHKNNQNKIKIYFKMMMISKNQIFHQYKQTIKIIK